MLKHALATLVAMVCSMAFAQGTQAPEQAVASAMSAGFAQIKPLHDADLLALSGLQTGVKQIERLCKPSLKPLEHSSPSSTFAAAVAKEQDRYKGVMALAEKHVQQSQQTFSKFKAEQTSLCPNNELLKRLQSESNLKTCKALTDGLSRTSALVQLATQWRQAQQKRHQLFNSLFTFEQSACTRPGFSEKILLEHEKNLNPAQDAYSKLFEKELTTITADTLVPPKGGKP